MPVCGAGAGSGHPVGQLAPWEASGLTWMQESWGPCRCSHHPALSPARPPAWALPCSSTATAPRQLLRRPALAHPQKPGWPPKLGGFHIGTRPAWPCSRLRQRGGAAGDPGHRAKVRLSLLYMSPSAFKSRVCDLPIRYAKSSKIRNDFQPGNSVTSIFPPFFFFL